MPCVTTAVINARIEALDAAMSSGYRRVRFHNGDEVEYTTVADMLLARAQMISQLSSASSTARVRRRLVTSIKGT